MYIDVYIDLLILLYL